MKLFGGITLINNAGVSIQLINDENYEEYWDKTFNVLLKAQAQLIRKHYHLFKNLNQVEL